MWILIPDPDGEKTPWTGQISRDVAKSSWSFELIRSVDIFSLYRKDPFRNANNVVGLLDYQTPCTLIRPIVTSINSGSLGVKNKGQRTIIKGEFEALLSDIAVDDGDEPKFLGLSFESEALDVWHNAPGFEHSFDFKTWTPTLDIKPTERNTFVIGGLGQVTVTRTSQISPKTRFSALNSATIFRVEFENKKSINQVITLSLSLERLFGFLIGFRGPYPLFTTWTSDKLRVGDVEWNHDGTLEVGNVNCSESEPPYHPFSCVHLKGIAGAELPSILQQFLMREGSVSDRIAAVEFSRFFSQSIADRFANTLPTLESYVQGRYTAPDEESYITAEAEFFAWIATSPSATVRNFAKKHVSVKERKTPSLKTLLSRAIAFANERGFRFDSEIAGRIQSRRGALFHATPKLNDEDVKNFYVETQAITCLLLLHTIADLGIDISYLAQRYHALSDMRDFMSAPTQQTHVIPTTLVELEQGKKDEPS